MSYDPDATGDKNLPTCESCGIPFRDHLGLAGTCAELTALRAELAAVFNLQQYVESQRDWSGLTFGKGHRTEGILKHIESELAEIRESPLDVEEWCDVVILALDGAWRTGASIETICQTLKAKQAKNMARRWEPVPDDAPSFHVKEPKA